MTNFNPSNAATIDPAHCAHLAVDVQRRYCSTFRNRSLFGLGYRALAKNILNRASPAFNQAGVKTYWIWMSKHDVCDLYNVKKIPLGDETLQKRAFSAFDATVLREKLLQDNVKTVMISGFYAQNCVLQTAFNAAQDFNTFLLADCTDIHMLQSRDLIRLEQKQVMRVTAPDILKRLG